MTTDDTKPAEPVKSTCSEYVHFSHLFRAFSIAVQPGKLFAAWLMVISLFLVGLLMDGAEIGGGVYRGEFEAFVNQSARPQKSFDQWRDAQDATLRSVVASILGKNTEMSDQDIDEIVSSKRFLSHAINAVQTYRDSEKQTHKEKYTEARRDIRQKIALLEKELPDDVEARERLGKIYEKELSSEKTHLELAIERVNKHADQAIDDIIKLKPRGVFAVSFEIKWQEMNNIAEAIVKPSTWTGHFDAVSGPLFRMIDLARWIWQAHIWFFIVWAILGTSIWAFAGGTISRMAIIEVAQKKRIAVGQAFGYAHKRWWNYFITPIAIPVVIGCMALCLALVGVVLFQWLGGIAVVGWVSSVIGALGYIVAIAVGVVAVLLMICFVLGQHMMYPALSAEGTDVFDAISRSFAYVVAHPWRLIAYCFVSIIYGAITYLVVSAVIIFSLEFARDSVGYWVPGFSELLPQTDLIHSGAQAGFDQLSKGEVLPSFILCLWSYLVLSLSGAYIISFYMSVSSIIYLLMRRHTDGTDISYCYEEVGDVKVAVEKVEPAQQNDSLQDSFPDSQAETSEENND